MVVAPATEMPAAPARWFWLVLFEPAPFVATRTTE